MDERCSGARQEGRQNAERLQPLPRPCPSTAGATPEIASLFGAKGLDLKREPSAATSAKIAETGIGVHFGGHMHANDAAQLQNGTQYLVNIQTPSLAAYVPAYKEVIYRSPKSSEYPDHSAQRGCEFQCAFRALSHGTSLQRGACPGQSVERKDSGLTQLRRVCQLASGRADPPALPESELALRNA